MSVDARSNDLEAGQSDAKCKQAILRCAAAGLMHIAATVILA